MNNMRFVDLFCGIGGFHHALSDLGHECVFACEIDHDCNQVYSLNWQMSSYGDIRKLNKVVPDHDILCAGFPCQPFSKSGTQIGLKEKMYGQTNSFLPRIKGTLFGQIKEIIEDKKPNFILLENVQNLESHDQGRTLRIIRGALDELGYYCREEVISPHHFGIPHHRPRIFIVGIRRDVRNFSKFKFPQKEDQGCDVWNLYDGSKKEDLDDSLVTTLDHWTEFMKSLPKGITPPSPTWSMEFGRSYPLDDIHPISSQTKLELCKILDDEGIDANPKWKKQRILDLYPPYIRKMTGRIPDWKRQFIQRNRKFWEKYKLDIGDDWLNTTRKFSDTHQKFEWHAGKTANRDVMKHMIHSRPSGIRVSKMDRIPALVAIAQIPIIGPWRRKLTTREAARAQSFRDDFQLHEKDAIAFKQLGNSVNVEVVKRIMIEIEKIAQQSGIYESDEVLNQVDIRFQNQNR